MANKKEVSVTVNDGVALTINGKHYKAGDKVSVSPLRAWKLHSVQQHARIADADALLVMDAVAEFQRQVATGETVAVQVGGES